MFPYTIGRIEHGFNVRPDLVQTDTKLNPRFAIHLQWIAVFEEKCLWQRISGQDMV